MGRGFYSFSVEVGETGLALTYNSDRHMEARDGHVSSPSGRDDCYIAGCGGTSRAYDSDPPVIV